MIFSIGLAQAQTLKPKVIGDLPKKLKETSGLIYNGNGQIWTLNDGGNAASIYLLSDKGEIKKEIKLKDAKNYDWEALTKDDEGNFYIGDIGNNANNRKHLKIYKIKNPNKVKDNDVSVTEIKFKYKSQDEFPPKKSRLYYDCESMIVINDTIFLFSKNRTKPFDGKVKVFAIPAKKGEYKAKKVDELYTNKGSMYNYWVTDACLSPDKKTLVLLSTNKIYVYTNFKGTSFSSGERTMHHLSGFSQKEGICFKNNNELYITDEILGPTGGKLYLLKLPK